VRRVEWSQTAGELGAMLREAQLMRDCKPRYNRRAGQGGGSLALRPSADGSGRVDVLQLEDLEASELEECFGVFRSEKDARKALRDLARAHHLCLKVLGLEESPGSCLARQVGGCRGACVGGEAVLLHALRVRMALSSLKIKSWPFAGRIALRERSRDVEEFHVLEHWTYVGSASCEEELAALCAPARAATRVAGRTAAVFDADVYKILLRYFSHHSKLDCHELPDVVN
jgi:DNA polymerase-3 subunit epsilon